MTRIRARWLVSATLSICTAAGAQATRPAGVNVGDRVRVATVDLPTERIANVLAAAPDSVILRYLREFGDSRIAWTDLRLLAVSDGRRSTMDGLRRGARRGLITGLVLSGVSALASVVVCAQAECFGSELYGVIAIPVVLTVGCTTVGGLLGAAAPGERWRPISLPRRSGQPDPR